MDKPKRKRTVNKLSQVSLINKLGYFKAFNKCISAGNTGTLEELARKFEISESLTQEILIYMIDELNCPINYSQARKTYFYEVEGKLLLGFTPGSAF